jgi:hypothetical protein
MQMLMPFWRCGVEGHDAQERLARTMLMHALVVEDEAMTRRALGGLMRS